jgi:imidazole glycerol-phosphate synthase subunit HisF
MLAKRIIPCLDVRNGRVVKGTQFGDIHDVDDPARLGKQYSDEGADELVFYDITASSEQRKISLEFVEKVAKNLQIPFSVGGGVETIEDFQMILRKGADKISINSGAVKNPDLITKASLKFGAQCVVLSIDAKKNDQGSWSVYIHGGRTKTNLDAVEWAVQGAKLGAGEIVVNSIDEDGMRNGYDIKLLKAITDQVNVPVIASGGAGTIKHFYDAIKEANVDGILAASVFHYGDIKINTLKKELSLLKIPMRNNREENNEKSI